MAIVTLSARFGARLVYGGTRRMTWLKTWAHRLRRCKHHAILHQIADGRLDPDHRFDDTPLVTSWETSLCP